MNFKQWLAKKDIKPPTNNLRSIIDNLALIIAKKDNRLRLKTDKFNMPIGDKNIKVLVAKKMSHQDMLSVNRDVVVLNLPFDKKGNLLSSIEDIKKLLNSGVSYLINSKRVNLQKEPKPAFIPTVQKEIPKPPITIKKTTATKALKPKTSPKLEPFKLPPSDVLQSMFDPKSLSLPSAPPPAKLKSVQTRGMPGVATSQQIKNAIKSMVNNTRSRIDQPKSPIDQIPVDQYMQRMSARTAKDLGLKTTNQP